MQEEPDINRLRREMIESLERPDIDYGRLVTLSSQIANLDPSNVRFSVDAGLISRLGKELVGYEYTAVSELVKNSYDADATEVELLFENAHKPGGTLTINDDGGGMSRQQLINGFMRLASTSKVSEPTSPKYKRGRAGRKGIGRFAAQSLGSKLTVITQTEDSNSALRVDIDWSLFKSDTELTSIASRIEQVEKVKEHGTILSIKDLADAWSDDTIARVYGYLADLIQPFPLSKRRKKSKTDPGFEARMYRVDNGKRETIADVGKIVYDYAVAEIEGYVDRQGHGVWSIHSDRFSIDEKALPIGKGRDGAQVPFGELKDVYFKAYYYIYNSGLIPKAQNKLILEMARLRGGVRVYRNGFRVLPYGAPFNDWLRLDDSYARREILPPHGNQNFFGFVEITDPKGQLFEETASREGLIENQAFT